MNRIETHIDEYTIAVEWTGPPTPDAINLLNRMAHAVPNETRRAKDAVYLLSGSDADVALATWGSLLSSLGWNPPLTRTQADQIISEAQSLASVPPPPASVEPGRATTKPPVDDVADGVGPGTVSSGEGPSRVPSPSLPSPDDPLGVAVELAAAADHLKDKTTKPELRRHILDLFDAMWSLGVWGPDSLVDALDGPVSTLDSMNKQDLLSFTRAWCKRAQADLVADAPGGTR